jgi:transposase
MPAQITISAEELNALLAMREAYATLEREHEETRSMLRLVSAERGARPGRGTAACLSA